MLASLLPLVLGMAPQLAQHLFGTSGSEIAASVAGAVAAVTRSDLAAPGGAEAAILAIQGKSELAVQLQIKLAEIAASAQVDANRAAEAQHLAELGAMTAAMADVTSARTTEIALAQSHSNLAWGAPLLSGIILLAFGGMLFVVLTRAIPENSTALANVLLGTLAAMATQVANFWLGSSSGSASKSLLLANSMPISLQGKAP